MKRHLVIATAAAAALLAGGTVTAVAAGSDSGSAPQQTARQTGATGQDTAQVQSGATDDDAREAKTAKVTAPDAAAAALKAVPGTVTALDLDNDRSGLVWEADVLGKDGKQHEVTLDAGSARVLNQHIDRDDEDDSQERTALKNALKDTRTDASEAARTAASRGTVTSVDLDDDHGTKPVWEVETTDKNGKEQTLLVNPQSGNLTPAPADDNDDDTDD